MLKSAKYTNYISRSSNDPKKQWKVIKEATNDQIMKTEKISSIVNSENVELTNKKIIANEFNKYFITIGKKIAEQIKKG